ncbi:MAG: YHS domain-containing (seleno)protein [Ignavibacteriaceae bacterium]
MKLVKYLTVIMCCLVLTTSQFAQDKMMDDKKMLPDHMMMIDKDKNGAAIKGYDAVAYFTDSKAVMGKADYTYKWMDAEWHFASKSHLDMFKKNPEKYVPQYGGYCAFGIAMNHCSSADPTAWKIVEGKLYLYTNEDVEGKWSKDVKESIMKSDEYWIKETAKK